MPIKFDFQKSFAAANATAESQEETIRAMLWNRVSEKAKTDEGFRKQLADDPKKTVEIEAQHLTAPEGRKIEVSQGVVANVTNQARAEFSHIVPDVKTDKVEKLIFATIDDIKRAFRITLLLSQVLFYAGLAMVVAGFVAGLVDETHKLLSLFFGGGGIASMLISSLVVSPLDRVQNAAGNLIQLQMAYLAYYKQLYLLGGNNATISREDALAYAREIDRVTSSLMKSVQTYVEKNENDAKTDSTRRPGGKTSQGKGGGNAGRKKTPPASS